MPISRVDATALVEVELERGSGYSDLWSVLVGERVRCSDGLFHEVTDKNMRAPERSDYVQVVDGSRVLICCAEHVIDDVRAVLRPHVVVRPVHSGDLAIDGSDDYIANGFKVQSMLRRR